MGKSNGGVRRILKGVRKLKISVSFGSDNDSVPSNKKSVHKKPWFWLLLILIASVAVRMSSRNKPELPFLNIDDEDELSSAFNFEPKTDSFTVKEDYGDDITQFDESQEPAAAETGSESQKLVTQDENGKSVFHFILNISTKKYHTKECSAVKKLADEKRSDTDIEADSLKEAKEIIEEQGYELCGLCDR